MSKETKDGGPAFPAPVRRFDSKEEALDFDKNGMSLRDYFAAAATVRDIDAAMVELRGMGIDIVRTSKARYFHADAMLAERDKK